VNVPTTDSNDLQKMSEIGNDELISSDGWPDSYQERKLSNHVAATQLPEGVVVSYCWAL
jgi:hypothetical protein